MQHFTHLVQLGSYSAPILLLVYSDSALLYYSFPLAQTPREDQKKVDPPYSGLQYSCAVDNGALRGILHYITLHYIILYYTILYYTILYYTILYYTMLYCTRLDYTAQGLGGSHSCKVVLTASLFFSVLRFCCGVCGESKRL